MPVQLRTQLTIYDRPVCFAVYDFWFIFVITEKIVAVLGLQRYDYEIILTTGCTTQPT